MIYISIDHATIKRPVARDGILYPVPDHRPRIIVVIELRCVFLYLPVY